MSDVQWEDIRERFVDMKHELTSHMKNVEGYLVDHPELSFETKGKVHSSRSRIKNEAHLREKIARKSAKGRDITPDNLFSEVTDLVGVRVLLLFQQDFADVDRIVRGKVDLGDWYLDERPKAFTWDPEARQFFERFDLDVETRDTFYTSVHYLIRPHRESPLCCEVQVRTLFEEIWGEVDHRLNYPKKVESVACREQLLVLSKIVGAGSRLVDSIRRTMEDEHSR
ncbi:MAG: RelA/SpoT domain-containing protein [Maritimibacter sp.]|nr:RelA/SpoT domain-containing protein [Maritimibacter sp.]